MENSRHHCSSLIIHCIDFRFINAINEFLKQEKLIGDCDVVALAGSVKELSNKKNHNNANHVCVCKNILIEQIEKSKALHGISRIIIISHEDCGAYGGKINFAGDEEEFAKHKEDFLKAKSTINSFFPELKIEFIFARLKEETNGDRKIWFEKPKMS